MKNYMGFSALSLAIASANTVFAQDAVDQAIKDESQVEELMVWATKVKASSIDLNEESMAIKQADHISDLLRTIPGIDVGGAHSLNQRITIRSMDDKDLRITIDGANQNTYMYHHMGNLQIHADILQSVDVEVGTNSVVNGGLGGAVRFETKTADQLLKEGEQFGARIQGGYGDNANESWSLTGYGKLTEQLDFLVYHNAVNKDNYDVGGGEIKDQDGNVVPGSDGKVRGLEGEVADTLVKLGWNIQDNHRIELGYETYKDEGDYSYRPDMGLATDLSIGSSLDAPLVWPTEFTRDTLTLNYEGQLGDTFITATLYSNESSLARDETGFATSTAIVRGEPVSNSAGFIDGDADNSGLSVIAETEWGINKFTYGLDYTHYETRYEADLVTGFSSSEEDATATSFFVQDRIQVLDSLALIPGVRFDQYEMNSTLVDDTYDDVSWALAAEYEVSSSLVVKLSTTQLFKAPEIGEVFVGAGLSDMPNSGIDAETGYNNEFSLAYEDAVLGADRFAFGFTVFDTHLEDYIYDYAEAPASLGGGDWKDNIGDMSIDGYEVYAGYDIDGLAVLLTYSDAESDLNAFSDYASLDGARIDRQQGDTISLSVDYHFEPLNLTLHWDMLDVGDVAAGLDLDGATVDNSKDSYQVHNISLRWTHRQIEGLAVTLGIDNLTDEYYASHSSRTGTSFHPLFGSMYLLDYEPGRNYKATVSYTF